MSHKFKVAVIGNPNVGCDSLCIRFVHNAFEEEVHPYYDYGVVDTYRKQMIVDEELALLELVVVGGSKHRDSIFRASDGFILVFDAKRPSFEALSVYLAQIQRVKECNNPTIICATKSDLADRFREVSESAGQQLAERSNAAYFVVSSKEGRNVEITFRSIVRRIRVARDGGFDLAGAVTSIVLVVLLANRFERQSLFFQLDVHIVRIIARIVFATRRDKNVWKRLLQREPNHQKSACELQ